ncbi:TIGR02391 family protein [Dactylosporangium sp. NPDC049742]|uniref:TIGR02391 family protein n=1 Tax=Dactylosporangium sp. NPDC049742 TaxID=3154737 RepID=UPI00341201FD
MSGPPQWPGANLKAVVDVLASTDPPGLSNGEIEQLLMLAGIGDPAPGKSKRIRLLAALQQQQQSEGSANPIERFMAEAMSVARYLNDEARFDALLTALRRPLALLGLDLDDGGRLIKAESVAYSLDDVAKLTDRLRSELRRRGVHPQVLYYCEEELVRKSLFHAVFEATKGVSDRLRRMTGLRTDGGPLVREAFGGNAPLVRLNGLSHHTDLSEQSGFSNFLTGVFGMFRNPPAHSTRVDPTWALTETDALDLFTVLSLVHRRLDAARVVPTG